MNKRTIIISLCVTRKKKSGSSSSFDDTPSHNHQFSRLPSVTNQHQVCYRKSGWVEPQSISLLAGRLRGVNKQILLDENDIGLSCYLCLLYDCSDGDREIESRASWLVLTCFFLATTITTTLAYQQSSSCERTTTKITVTAMSTFVGACIRRSASQPASQPPSHHRSVLEKKKEKTVSAIDDDGDQ